MLNSKLVLDPLKCAHTTTVSVTPSPWLPKGSRVPSLWFRSKQTHPCVESQQSLSENNEDCIRIILHLMLSCQSDKLNLRSLSYSLGCTYNSRDSLPSVTSPCSIALCQLCLAGADHGNQFHPAQSCSAVASCAIRSHLVSAFQGKEFLETAC